MNFKCIMIQLLNAHWRNNFNLSFILKPTDYFFSLIMSAILFEKKNRVTLHILVYKLSITKQKYVTKY